MHTWYKIFTYLFYPFAPIYLYIRKLKKKEDSLRYKEKLSKIETYRKKGFLIWIHVASVGEAMSIIPLIENLIKEEKINTILLTSITLSSGRILKEKYNQNQKVIHQFLPLDIPIFVNKFLNHWKPNLSVFIDSEIWPNLILTTKKKKIPLLLLNARITKKTFKRWKFLKEFSKKIFTKFDLCIASNKESEEFLKLLGAKNIKNYGNLKFSNIKNSFKRNLDPTFLYKIKNRKVWCAASTHNNEEILCGETHLEIKKKYNNIFTIIIPRHINRVNKIKEDLLNLGLKVSTYSKLEEVSSSTDILIVDAYGESLKFYNISKSVFVGKSLIKNLTMDGGQNPIEPARLGCTIFHGPHVSNFTEIYNFLKKLNVTKEINNSSELSLSLVEKFNQNDNKNDNISEKIENYGQNIFNNVMIELKKYINNDR
jgi:3-deoxy-D-manno-octulosonic-acid transferase